MALYLAEETDARGGSGGLLYSDEHSNVIKVTKLERSSRSGSVSQSPSQSHNIGVDGGPNRARATSSALGNRRIGCDNANGNGYGLANEYAMRTAIEMGTEMGIGMGMATGIEMVIGVGMATGGGMVVSIEVGMIVGLGLGTGEGIWMGEEGEEE